MLVRSLAKLYIFEKKIFKTRTNINLVQYGTTDRAYAKADGTSRTAVRAAA